MIRACYNQRPDNPDYARLTFCLLGVATPADLITDKTRTPFNLGRAIALHGFMVAEAQGLAQGLVDSVPDPVAALAEILDWTGGQPFLTQKLCRLVVQTAQQSTEPIAIEQVVRSQILAQWEAQDEPEHLRTIRDRLLRDERRANRLLGLYAEILQWGDMAADDRDGQMELRLAGLVVKQNGVLRVHNPIYAAVFDQTWVDATLDRLRPYQEAFHGWLASEQQDESRLLRGQALTEALEWSTGRSLSPLDALFLSQSQAIENRETKQANAILAKANQQAKHKIRLGSGLLGLAVLAAGAIGLWSFRAIGNAKQTIDEARAITRLEREGRNTLEQFKTNQTEALKAAMQAVHELKTRFGDNPAAYPTLTPVTTLQTILHRIREQPLRAFLPLRDKDELYFPSAQPSVQFTAQGVRVFLAPTQGGSAVVANLQGERLHRIKTDQDSLVYRIHFGDLSAKLSPDGQVMANPTRECTTQLWNLQGKLLATLRGHHGPLQGMQFSPNSKYLVTWEMDKIPDKKTACNPKLQEDWLKSSVQQGLVDFKLTVRLWDLQGNQLAILYDKENSDASYTGVDFSPDGQHFLAMLKNSLSTEQRGHRTRQVYTIQGNEIAPIYQLEDTTEAVEFSPDGQTLVTSDKNGTIHFRTLQGQRLRSFQTPDNTIDEIRFSPDGKRFATVIHQERGEAKDVSMIRLWTVQGNLLATFTSSSILSFFSDYSYSSPSRLNFTPDGNRLVTTEGELESSNLMLRLWNLQGQEVQRLSSISNGNVNDAPAVSFSSDGQYAFLNDDSEFVSLWSLARPTTFNGTQGKIRSLQFNASGDRLLARDNNGTVHLWDRQGKSIATIPGQVHTFRVAQFTPVGDRFVTYDNQSSKFERSIRVWNLQGQQQAFFKGRWPVERTRGKTHLSQLISPDGNYMVVEDVRGRLRIWNLNGKSTATLQIPSRKKWEPYNFSFERFQFSPDGKLIAGNNSYGEIGLWNLQGKLLRIIRSEIRTGMWNIRFTSDSQGVIAISEDPFSSVYIPVWDLQGRKLASFQQIQQGNRSTLGLANTVVSPKGDLFVTRLRDSYMFFQETESTRNSNPAIVWDATGRSIAQLEGESQGSSNPPSSSMEVQFSADGKRMITNTGRIIRVWDTDGRLIAQYDGYAATLSPDSRYIVVVSAETNTPTLWPVDDVDGLLQRSCDWLRFAIAFSDPDEPGRQICNLPFVR